MIPILYEATETEFTSNGLGRLRDCESCVVVEGRNDIYECDFKYPVDGAHFDEIIYGRIIAVEHDGSSDIQPFDIVGSSEPIDGVVAFHAVHISYRQSKLTVSGTGINSLRDAFTLFMDAEPSNPFGYWTDKESTGRLACADGVPHSVRSMLGGIEGSILDAYGGEYEWDKFTVKLWGRRGTERDLVIRYGLNMIDYNEDIDYSETYSSVIPYWIGNDEDNKEVIVKGARVDSRLPMYHGRNDCVPMDLSDKFEEKPTTTQLEEMALNIMSSEEPNLPEQTLEVDFMRLQDMPEYQAFASLMQCSLCDIITVVYRKSIRKFKIVKTEYDVLTERYKSMELGTLGTTLSTALGMR